MNPIYENDYLQREPYVKKLKQFIENQIPHGRTVLLNGRFGEGKTTIINYLKQEFISEKSDINCLYYNVWENNFYEEPLIPFLCTLENLKSKSKRFVDASKRLLSTIPKIFADTLAHTYGLDFTSVLENENITTFYSEFKKALIQYKEVIETSCKSKKLLIIVDELDRCLPSYQIKFLERMHHIFSNIPNLFVIVAVDQSQLENSIKMIFSDKTNLEGYLYKFFDFMCDIPTSTKFEFYVNELSDSSGSYILDAMNLSTRDSMKLLSEHEILMNSFPEFKNSNWVSDFFMFLLFVKHKNRDIYYRYFVNIDYNKLVADLSDRFFNFKRECNQDVKNILNEIYKIDRLLYICINTIIGTDMDFNSVFKNLTPQDNAKIRPYFYFSISTGFHKPTIRVSCQDIEYEIIYKAIQILI